MTIAYYSENDPFAAAWLGQLIADGLIAPGVVDSRDIRDVTPSDLKGFTQCHFFAGIGVWSLALRHVGWDDSRECWTGSCPCQPFSSAGSNGGFDDERHLWPAWQWLIDQCRPKRIVGEQVASRNVDPWVDLVQADLEGMGYAFGCVPFPAASVGAPHIRDRLYWLADTGRTERWQEPQGRQHVPDGADARRQETASRRSVDSATNRLVDSDQPGLEGLAGHGVDRNQSGWLDARSDGYAAAPSGIGGLVNADSDGQSAGREIRSVRAESDAEYGVAVSRLADGPSDGRRQERSDADGQSIGNRPQGQSAGSGSSSSDSRPGPTNGYWRDADWLFCRDGKWRPVEPGTFPLAPAGTFRNRVAELCGAGNAVNVAQAAGFLRAVMETIG